MATCVSGCGVCAECCAAWAQHSAHLTLQDRASPVIEQLIFFHDHALIIITTVFYTIIRIIQNKQTIRFILEGQILEPFEQLHPQSSWYSLQFRPYGYYI